MLGYDKRTSLTSLVTAAGGFPMTDAGSWRKITPNALFPCGESMEWDRDPSAPHVLRVGDKLRMYYHGRLDGRIRIGFAGIGVAERRK